MITYPLFAVIAMVTLYCSVVSTATLPSRASITPVTDAMTYIEIQYPCELPDPIILPQAPCLHNIIHFSFELDPLFNSKKLSLNRYTIEGYIDGSSTPVITPITGYFDETDDKSAFAFNDVPVTYNTTLLTQRIQVRFIIALKYSNISPTLINERPTIFTQVTLSSQEAAISDLSTQVPITYTPSLPPSDALFARFSYLHFDKTNPDPTLPQQYFSLSWSHYERSAPFNQLVIRPIGLYTFRDLSSAHCTANSIPLELTLQNVENDKKQIPSHSPINDAYIVLSLPNIDSYALPQMISLNIECYNIGHPLDSQMTSGPDRNGFFGFSFSFHNATSILNKLPYPNSQDNSLLPLPTLVYTLDNLLTTFDYTTLYNQTDFNIKLTPTILQSTINTAINQQFQLHSEKNPKPTPSNFALTFSHIYEFSKKNNSHILWDIEGGNEDITVIIDNLPVTSKLMSIKYSIGCMETNRASTNPKDIIITDILTYDTLKDDFTSTRTSSTNSTFLTIFPSLIKPLSNFNGTCKNNRDTFLHITAEVHYLQFIHENVASPSLWLNLRQNITVRSKWTEQPDDGSYEGEDIPLLPPTQSFQQSVHSQPNNYLYPQHQRHPLTSSLSHLHITSKETNIDYGEYTNKIYQLLDFTFLQLSSNADSISIVIPSGEFYFGTGIPMTMKSGCDLFEQGPGHEKPSVYDNILVHGLQSNHTSNLVFEHQFLADHNYTIVCSPQSILLLPTNRGILFKILRFDYITAVLYSTTTAGHGGVEYMVSSQLNIDFIDYDRPIDRLTRSMPYALIIISSSFFIVLFLIVVKTILLRHKQQSNESLLSLPLSYGVINEGGIKHAFHDDENTDNVPIISIGDVI